MSISRFNSLAACLLFVIALSACNFDRDGDDGSTCRIVSPQPAWVYYDDSPITFSMDIDSDGIEWRSSLDGGIGTGNAIVSYLSVGTHTITAVSGDTTRSVKVTVCARDYASLDEKGVLLNASTLTCVIPAFMCYPYVVACDGAVKGLTLDFQDESRGSRNKARTISPMVQYTLRDIGIRRSPSSCSIDNQRSATRKDAVEYEKGDTRQFRVINTKNQMGEPHLLSATVAYASDTICVWVVDGAIIDMALLDDIRELLETLILPRVMAIWGEWGDIDGDGRIAIVFSPTINDEGIATGFFNPCDFFSYNDDSSVPEYNPASNEMDVVYLAVPEVEGSSSFSVSTILATAAHEMTHAVTYTQKTWKPLLAGDETACQEELFLDEGWSHLSETLCGYGVSGGNVKFLEVFLKNTQEYSFCGISASGQDDSAGRRGAMAMFLSWLFWKKGGMTWDTKNPVLPVDSGGIEFLKGMISSSETGWESIGAAYGTSTRTLFRDFASDLNRNRLVASGFEGCLDPITGEPSYLFTNMGEVTYNTASLVIGNPCSTDCFSGNTVNLVGWSFQMLDPFENDERSVLSISQKGGPSDAWLQILLY